jgi:CRISPR-associated protein Csb1
MPEPAKFDFTPFDALLAVTGPAVIALQQKLTVAAISGDDIVFPPSYAPSAKKKDGDDKSTKKDKETERDSVYNIDVLDPWNPTKNVCVLDSIPSQANRIEPLFAKAKYKDLVPQYEVQLTPEIPAVSILSVGHRLADAVFRGTTLRAQIVDAFKEYAAKGNAIKLARLGPTSLVFGVWDSRGTGVKIPRLVNSIVRAFNVVALRRSAQYTPPVKYKQEGLLPPGLDVDPAEHGLADVPSPLKIGGVQINGEIRRDCSLNVELIRSLRGSTEDETRKLQRYILALALIALTATPPATLRQGCTLIPQLEDQEAEQSKGGTDARTKLATWKQFYANGKTDVWDPAKLEILTFARAAASNFGVNQPDVPLQFKPETLKASIEADSKTKADKLAENAGDPTGALRSLVEAVVIDPAKHTFKNTKPAKSLRERLTGIGDNVEASAGLKSIAAQITALLDAEGAAEERKQKMLALFTVATTVVAAPASTEAADPEIEAQS